jgi:hypothetical protein
MQNKELLFHMGLSGLMAVVSYNIFILILNHGAVGLAGGIALGSCISFLLAVIIRFIWEMFDRIGTKRKNI